MNSVIPQIAAVALLGCAVVPTADAEFVRGNAVFQIEYIGSGEVGDFFDPPLLGSGWFVVRSLPYDPDVVDEDPSPFSEFDVLDLSFSFADRTWDESDVAICECYFTPDGQPLGINFDFDDGAVSWILSWNFEDGNFGFRFDDGVLNLAGTSEDGIAGGAIDFSFFVVPEPGSLALLLIGLAAGALARRRRVTPGDGRAGPRSRHPTAASRPSD